MAEIFLSYRRDDSTSATGRLADALEAHFGDDRVFRDREIGAGDNFVEAIRRSVESSTVVLVVVGRRWLAAGDTAGRRRLDDADDFVRLEIELALAAHVAVVPVLVEGATMPSAAELPPSLAEFSRCQAVELSDTRWRYDVDRLVEMLQARFAIDSEPAPFAPASGGGVGALTRLAADLIELALHPKRLIARRQTGRASDAARALGFLAAAILIGNVVLLLGIDMPALGDRSHARGVGSTVSWLLAALFVGVVFAGVLTAPLALAWRVVERGARYRRVGLVSAYVYGGAWLGLCAGVAVLGAGVQLVDPDFIARALDSITAAVTVGSASAPLAVMRPFGGSPLGIAAIVVTLLGYAILVASLVWAVAAWGAFRQSFGATRLQSWLATSLWLACLAALVGLALRLG
jgi:hypothetical protein